MSPDKKTATDTVMIRKHNLEIAAHCMDNESFVAQLFRLLGYRQAVAERCLQANNATEFELAGGQFDYIQDHLKQLLGIVNEK